MKKILIVDDEIQILKSLTRMFIDTDYKIYTAQNSTDALDIIEKEGIDMIISDMRMPLIDGYKLLNIVKEKYPKVIRILLSGYTEEKPMFRALLHNLAKLYIFKPWNSNSFLQNINKLFENDSLMNSKDLIDTIDNLDKIYNSPGNCCHIMERLSEENTDEVIRLIEQDPELSSSLLQVSQSAVYGVMPGTVRQAALYIGLPNLKSFVYWTCLKHRLKNDESAGSDVQLLNKHSYLTNKIYLFIYEAFCHRQPPEASMFAGLMHNIGLLILHDSMQNKSGENINPLTAEELMQLDSEECQHNHQMIGAHFVDIWDLPFSIYEAVLYHHRPTDSNIVHNELVAAVHIAQAYAWKVLTGSDIKPIDPQVFNALNITPEEFDKKLSRYLKQVKL